MNKISKIKRSASDEDPEWEIDLDHLVIGEKIGSGGSGNVYAGTYFHVEVAIKQLMHLGLQVNTAALEEFEREVEVWKGLSFPNIIQLYGVCTKPKNLCMVMARCKESLFDTLRTDIGWTRRLNIAHDVICGMLYLHSKGVLHRDMKSMNVLLTEDGTVKICDFGVAKHVRTSSSVETGGGMKGTPQWMSPEVCLGKTYTKKSDVYSFAVVMWEIASRRIPFQETKKNGLALIKTIIEGSRPSLKNLPIEKKIRNRYLQVMQKSWDANPKRRPTFTEILNEIQKMMDILDPIKRDEKRRRKKAVTLYNKGFEAYKEHKFDRAIKLLSEAQTLDPGYKKTYNYLSCCYMEQQNFSAALEISSKYVNNFPKSAAAYERKGDCLLYMKRYRDAWDVYKQGLKCDPSDVTLQSKMNRAAKDKDKQPKPLVINPGDVKRTFTPGAIGIGYEGNRITEVIPAGQADKAGICVGWRILAVNGNEQPDDAKSIVAAIAKTKSIGKKTEIIFASVKTRKILFKPGPYGISYEGNLITDVIPDSQAAKAGVRAGWRIAAIDGKEQSDNTKGIIEVINEKKKAQKTIEITFYPPVLDEDLDEHFAKSNETAIRGNMGQITPLTDIVHIGIEDYLKKKSSVTRHLWQRYYFVLNYSVSPECTDGPYYLRFYKSKKEGTRGWGIEIPCSEMINVAPGVKGKGSEDHCRFDITLTNSRLYSLLAETEYDCEKWVELIQGAIDSSQSEEPKNSEQPQRRLFFSQDSVLTQSPKRSIRRTLTSSLSVSLSSSHKFSVSTPVKFNTPTSAGSDLKGDLLKKMSLKPKPSSKPSSKPNSQPCSPNSKKKKETDLLKQESREKRHIFEKKEKIIEETNVRHLAPEDKVIVPLETIALKELKGSFTKMMEDQPVLIKHPQSKSRHGRKHERVIIVDLEEGTLSWKTKKTDEKVNGSIKLTNITQIERGLITERMVRNMNHNDASRCFSIITDDRELNFEAANDELCNLWVQGLKAIIEKKMNNCILM